MMRFSILKKARVFISLIFFFLITFLFIDFTNSFSAKFIQGILYLQFIPSLVNFIKFTGLAAGGFVFIIVLTLIFGRVYCSTICPLGTLQDIIIWLNGKIRRKKTFRKQKAFNVLRYTVLIISVFLLLIGLFTPLLFLDPYSNYGRIV
ncbi:MAG: 4Fe-4S binding protein, partial [Bacteroidales bacterium]|nr:4Fe-4S binding protein [Bacteroidales bacterium]